MYYDVVFIGAHPDDMILSCGGSISAFFDKGLHCKIISLTNGSYSDSEKADTRIMELKKSSEILNVDFEVLGLTDTLLIPENDNSELILDILCSTNPRVIVTHNMNDFHPDHVATYHIVKRAIFYYFVRESSIIEKRLKSILYTPPIRLNIENFNKFKIDYLVDISLFLNKKIESIEQHKSQHSTLKKNMEITIALNRMLGKMSSTEAAEGFLLEDLNIGMNHFTELF